MIIILQNDERLPVVCTMLSDCMKVMCFSRYAPSVYIHVAVLHTKNWERTPVGTIHELSPQSPA